MNFLKNNRKYTLIPMALSLFLLVSCGTSKTERLLTNKRWLVYDVKPPPGVFNIEKSQRAKQLKHGFYKDAWFEFLEDSVFVASFKGKPDTARYVIISKDEVNLYQRYRDSIYERLKIVDIDEHHLRFNTRKSDFHMTLLLKADSEK